MTRPSLWPRLGLMLAIAVGVATVWGFAIGTPLAQLESSMDRTRVYESLVVRVDGEAIIQTNVLRGGMLRKASDRTLDGKQVEPRRYAQLVGAGLAGEPEQRRWTDGPIGWIERLAWIDGMLPDERWFVIRSGGAEGRAYLAGYDGASNLPVGFIGRKGFRPTPPPEGEQFDLGQRVFGYESGGALTGIALYGVRISQRVTDGGASSMLPMSCVYLVDGNKLVEADVRAREVRTVLTAPEGRFGGDRHDGAAGGQPTTEE